MRGRGAPLKFACQPGCIQCCDKPGLVYLTEAEVLTIAEFVGLETEEFEARYVRRCSGHLRLRSVKICPFLTETGCSIHPVKPVQCRTYPYWPSIVSNWKAEKQNCPGIGKGNFVRLEDIRQSCNELARSIPNVAF